MSEREPMTDRASRTREDLDRLSFWQNGLLPVVCQDADTGSVLMVAFANQEALEKTLETREMHYWSRSRQELWHKGGTSGNYQTLVSLHTDCDADTLLARVRPKGPACHTGEGTCFGDLHATGPGPGEGDGRSKAPKAGTHRPDSTLPELWAILEKRGEERPRDSYTVRLLEDENLRLKKLGEETAELIVALTRKDKEEVAEEGADLVYHLLTALLGAGVGLEQLFQALRRRRA